jgi:hypothetical protein
MRSSWKKRSDGCVSELLKQDLSRPKTTDVIAAPASPLKPDHSKWLRRRKTLRRVAWLVLLTFGILIMGDHLGWFGYRGDDWARFDGRSFQVLRSTDRATLLIADHPTETEVALLGVEISGANAAAFLNSGLAGRRVILKLDSLQTRDAQGRLLAYVYLDESECINVDIVRDGIAVVDRHGKWAMRALLEGAQAEAQKHARGVWRERVQPRGPTAGPR